MGNNSKGTDSLLRSALTGALAENGQLNIVLVVGGSVITGTATTYEKWARIMTADLPREGDNDPLDGDIPTPSDDDKHLNLVNVTIDGGMRTYSVGALRVRRDRIDAWVFGSLPASS